MILPSIKDDVAIRSGDRCLTFDELNDAARKAATVLAEAGVGRGDVVALCAYNGFAYFVFERATQALGARLTPINWHLTPAEVGYILDDCDAAAVIIHASFATKAMRATIGSRTLFVEPVAEEICAAYSLDVSAKSIAPKDVALSRALASASALHDLSTKRVPALFYTSGTSGKPKAVKRAEVTADVELALRRRASSAFRLDASCKIISVMTGPLYHSAPYAYAMSVLDAGGTLILQPRFNPTELLELIQGHEVTHLHMVPIMFQRLLALPEDTRSRYDLSSLLNVVHGAAPCPPEIKKRMIEWWGPIINEYYAMTEVGFIAVSNTEEWQKHPGSVGRAALGVDIEIQNESGVAQAPGVVGDICVRHEATDLFSYHGDEKKTDEVRRGGFVITGDIGYLDADGFLFISDRKTDMILSGGVNIYPAEVEAALSRIAAIRDAVVFGLPDDDYGERLVAVVVRRSDISVDQITKTLKQHLASFKVPRDIRFVDELPREDTGKIKKRLIRDACIEEKPKYVR